MKKFKAKNKPVCDAVIVTIEMDMDERSQLINSLQSGETSIDYDGSEYKVMKIHPSPKEDLLNVKLTIKPV